MAHPAAWLLAGAGLLAAAGVYVATRSGACPSGSAAVKLIANGPGSVCAGSSCTTGQATVCPTLGAVVQYQATPAAGHQFQGWDGPGGITTSDNPFQAVTTGAGFVRGTFA